MATCPAARGAVIGIGKMDQRIQLHVTEHFSLVQH